MKVVLQRVKNAYVKVDSEIISEINTGFLLLWGIEDSDSDIESKILINKIFLQICTEKIVAKSQLLIPRKKDNKQVYHLNTSQKIKHLSKLNLK